MPIRTASLHRQIEKNGQKLHQAMLSRIHSHGADDSPSDQEQALMEERRILKEAQATRHEQALHPKPKAPKFVAHETRAPKEPKAPKPHKEKAPKAAKPSKEHVSRAEKAAKKSAGKGA